MSRVLFSCVTGVGHLHPLLPLAHGFAEAGHEVAFAVAPSHRERVERDGFGFFAAGIEGPEKQARFAPYAAELEALPYGERRPFAFSRRFAVVEAPARLDGLRAAVDAWQPELAVHDSADLAAPLAAAAAGVPSANHGFGLVVPPDAVAAAAAEVEPLWRGLGVEPDAHAGLYRGTYVDLVPPTLRASAPPDGTPVEPVQPASAPPPHGEPEPAWLATLPDRPTVYVTLGTIFNAAGVFRLLLEALAPVDANVVVTVGRNVDPADLAPVPANARVERYVSQALLLPHCELVVSHGGSGSTFGALAAGLPMVLLPMGADQFENAERCEQVGVARRLLPTQLTVEAAREAVEAILADRAYADRARAVADEIAAMPRPREVAERLLGT